jgi:ribosomal protein S27AE
MAGIGSQLGRGIREFRDSSDAKDEAHTTAAATRYCPECGTAARAEASFCGQCGRALDAAAGRSERIGG